MNMLSTQKSSSSIDQALNFDLNYLDKKSNDTLCNSSDVCQGNASTLLDVNDDVPLSPGIYCKDKDDEELLDKTNLPNADIRLSDLSVTLAEIKPSNIPPVTVLDESNGIGVTLHFAKEQLKKHVFVIVITTVSKRSLPLSNYLFQAVIPKVSMVSGCI